MSYRCYEICIRRVQFDCPISQKCTMKWRKGLFPWNRGKEFVTGAVTEGKTLLTDGVVMKVLCKHSNKFHIKFANEKSKGTVLLKKEGDGWKWFCGGRVVKVEGDVTDHNWNQLSRFDDSLKMSKDSVNNESGSDVQKEEKEVNPRKGAVAAKTDKKCQPKKVATTSCPPTPGRKGDKNDIENILFAEVLARDVIRVNDEKDEQELAEAELKKKRVEEDLKKRRVEKVIEIISDSCRDGRVLMVREAFEKMSCNGNEVLFLGCLLGVRKNLVKDDKMGLNDIITVGKVVGEIGGVISAVENLIMRQSKKAAQCVVLRLDKIIKECTIEFKTKGLINEDVTQKFEEELFQAKQDMCSTGNVKYYKEFMKIVNKRFVKNLSTYQTNDFIVTKFAIDEIEEWCLSNLIFFSTESVSEAIHSLLKNRDASSATE
ncbi:hypothetical protein EIN_390800 [Entamoeba invadens IP1]|uniref:Uncharacterized protein n=1 Tax=Entamoeba invadens IP1 TaxID=370355 RepID=A0A0A1U571_ENTIV|nr:hypothetical protein EIN_390800 [Entamoeba invadens IP1]ELP89455.1 hypothetical protein EIN_390800 [Entamoeba invadens IP1]|eukprot:XP_004256226.1 hypothetical protein EIN_390800 [Entamoeba invadens IP1]